MPPAPVALVGLAELAGLRDRIDDPDRLLPLVLVSVAHDTDLPRVPVDELAQAVGDLATISVLATREVADEWRRTSPSNLHAYNGTVRFCPQPGSTMTTRFFVTWPGTDPAFTINRVVDRLAPPLPAATRAEQDLAWAEVRQAAGQLAEDAGTASAGEVPAESVAETARAIEALADAPDSSGRAEIRRELDDALAVVEELFEQLDRLTEARDRWRALGLGRKVFEDPEQQFRWEIDTEWSSLEKADQEQYPLRGYVLGVDWLDSVDALQGVAHERIIEVAVQVLTDRAWKINGREVHQLRTGQGGDNPYVVRDRDQAAAWRCSLQSNTPAARRLMWWQLTDGRVELGRVAVHDDLDLR